VLAQIKIPKAITPITPIIDVQDGYMAFPKQAKFDPLRQRFDRFFEDMIQNGTFTTLGQEYRVTLPY